MSKKKQDVSYKDICAFILQAIVTKPEDVNVSEEQDESETYTINIKVAKEDIGRVIGKEGKIIKAIRNVLRMRAIKEGKRIHLTLVE